MCVCVLVEAHGGRQTVEGSESKPIVVEGVCEGIPISQCSDIALIVVEWMLMWKPASVAAILVWHGNWSVGKLETKL